MSFFKDTIGARFESFFPAWDRYFFASFKQFRQYASHRRLASASRLVDWVGLERFLTLYTLVSALFIAPQRPLQEEALVEQEPPPRPTREVYEEAMAALTPELRAM